MLPRLLLFAVTASLGLSMTACSALTRPDEIIIAPEPPATPTLRELHVPAAAKAPAAPPRPGG